MDRQNYVHADPEILVGKPVVKGTRLSVEFMLGLFAAGWTQQQVLDNYSTLTLEGLRAVFVFVAELAREESLHALPRKQRRSILADGNYPSAKMDLLREMGHDVAAVAADSLSGSDKEVLARAAGEARIVPPFDRDCGELIFRLTQPIPAGAVYLRFEVRHPEEPA